VKSCHKAAKAESSTKKLVNLCVFVSWWQNKKGKQIANELSKNFMG
jgi:hypothetical protein